MKSSTAGRTVRFLTVVITTGGGSSGNLIGKTLRAERLALK
jgi:hypothetical protein